MNVTSSASDQAVALIAILTSAILVNPVQQDQRLKRPTAKTRVSLDIETLAVTG